MFKNILKKLEDPSRPLLGPNVKVLELWGLWLPENILKRSVYLTLQLIFVIFVATEFVDVWFIIDDLNLVMNNIKITLMTTTTLCKPASFLLWQRHWISLIEYVTGADAIQRNSDDVTKKNKITENTKYCRKIFYAFWSLWFFTALITIFTPFFKFFLSETYRENVKNGTEEYTQIIRSWMPFDINTIPGYLAASAYQILAIVFGGGCLTAFDTNAVVIMVFFKMELELLKMDSCNIYGTEERPVTDDEAKERLRDIHKRHLELVKFARIFDSCLSPVMFFYLFVCSVMLCLTVYQITIEQSVMQKAVVAEFLIFSIAQLFIFCWHSNEVLHTSLNLIQGPYESTWWTTDAKKRKDLYILIAQFRKVIVFSAGPFVKLTVSTFISILKGAYSYYTLLSQSQNN